MRDSSTDAKNRSRHKRHKPENPAMFRSVYLWGVCFNWWAALCATVQGKVNERLSVWKGHLVDNMANDTCYVTTDIP